MFGLFTKEPENLPGSAEANMAVRRELELHGDTMTAQRLVIHYAYPVAEGAKTRQRQIEAILRKDSFKVENSGHKDGISFAKQQYVHDTAFDRLTEQLQASLHAIGWHYDGWESAVVVDRR